MATIVVGYVLIWIAVFFILWAFWNITSFVFRLIWKLIKFPFYCLRAIIRVISFGVLFKPKYQVNQSTQQIFLDI